MNTIKYFVLDYHPAPDVGPAHIAGELNHEEYEWPLFTANPDAVEIKKNYVYTVSDPEIGSLEFDFYGDQSYMVSQRFCDLCRELSIPFRPVPLTLILRGQPIGAYFFFLPGKFVALLDTEKSEYEIDTDLETGEPLIDQLFPPTPVYKKITKFIPKSMEAGHLFSCIELGKLVCTDEFRKAALKQGLKGIGFTPMQDYIFDPWADW